MSYAIARTNQSRRKLRLLYRVLRRGRLKCLSRVRRKQQARFLGEGDGSNAIPLPGNWNHIVCEHLAALRLPPEREIEIVEELALHLGAAYEDALADGLSPTEAEARAMQSYDWRLLECELSRAERNYSRVLRLFRPRKTPMFMRVSALL